MVDQVKVSSIYVVVVFNSMVALWVLFSDIG